MVDVLAVISVVEFPLTILGSWLLFKKVLQNKKVKQLLEDLNKALSLFEKAVPILEEILEQGKKNGDKQE